jgi:broad specificity phosphatase PhoE
LRELDILHRLPERIELPFFIWGMIVGIKSFSSNKNTDKFRDNISALIDKIFSTNETNILIISHWFVMRVIRQELIKRGFKGDKFNSNENATLYVYQS